MTAARHEHLRVGEFIDLQRHCHVVGRVLVGVEGHEGQFVQASDWLDVAAGLVAVECVVGRFDDSLMYCEAPREYANERGRLLNEVVRQLSVLSFVWGAFETALAVWRPPGLGSGKVRAARQFLAEAGAQREGWSLPVGYEPLLSRFLAKVSNLDVLDDRDLMRLEGLKTDPVAGQGLGAVYLIRNHLAHGSLLLPEPGGWIGSGEAPLCPCVVETATRLVLLSLQMLADLSHPGATVDAYCVPHSDAEDPEFLPLSDVVLELHLNEPPPRPSVR